MSINVGEIPQVDGDLDAVDGAGSSLKSAGLGFAETGSDVHSTWQGLSGVYEAPESGELLAATAPVSSDSALVGSDVLSVGAALRAYAAEVKPIKAELERLKVEAAAFNTSIEGDEDWDKDQGKVDEKNNLLKSVNAAVAAWQAAERTCASSINATFGGVQYREDDGDGTHDADEYGYSAKLLDGATAGDEGVPWGKASERDKPWYEDAVDAVGSFGKGLVVDGLWGTVRGLGTLVGVDGAAAAGQAWLGVGKLALSTSLPAMILDQTVGVPGLEKGELGATQLAAGKALIAYDMWGKDPARASGAVVGNVIGAVVGTKGAGAAVKGAGTAVKAAEVGGKTAKVVGSSLEGVGNVAMKAGQLKVNLTDSLTTKVAGLGEKLQLPKLGPEPALAGAGGRGASRAFDVTPGSRTASSTSVAARIDDTAPAGGRGTAGSGSTLTDTAAANSRGGGASALHEETAGPDAAPARHDDLSAAPEHTPEGDAVDSADDVGTETGDIPSPEQGTPVWRAFGEAQDAAGVGLRRGSLPFGESWTPKNPELSTDFRRDAGLPDENPARYLIEGKLVRPENVRIVRDAIPLDGQPGGWPEYVITRPDEAVEVAGVRGVNEPWTRGPGDWVPPAGAGR